MARKRWVAPVAAVMALLVVFGLAKNLIAQAAVSGAVRLMTGLTLHIGSMDVGVFKSALSIRGLTLRNPPGFSERVMIDLPEVFVDYELGAFLRRRVHLEEVRLHLREFIVVKNAQGTLNLDALRPVQEAKARTKAPAKAAGGAAPMQIDRLRLKIGTVVYKDYSRGGEPLVQSVALNADEEYRNITNPSTLASLIVARALMRTTIARLAGIDLEPLKAQAAEQLRAAVTELGGGAEEALGVAQEAAQSLRRIIGLGGQ
jgi:hypothetical protein